MNIRIKAECSFINERVPMAFNRKPIYVCFLMERSDGHLVDFRRIRYYKEPPWVLRTDFRSAKQLSNGQDMLLTAELLNHNQYITGYVMCDQVGELLFRKVRSDFDFDFSIAGTMRYAELRPNLPASLFPTMPAPRVSGQLGKPRSHNDTSTQPSKSRGGENANNITGDEFSDDGLNDQDLLEAGKSAHYFLRSRNPNEIAVDGTNFSHIDIFDQRSATKFIQSVSQRPDTGNDVENSWSPKQLQNGKWACNHKCKDKTA